MSTTCFNCFRIKPDDGACIYCGYDHTGAEEKFPLALKPGTILANRYYLGRVLGQGGFGITYIALDGSTQSRVAIKEYLPIELAMRDSSTQALQVYSANARENYEYGKQQFLDEAKTLAQFYGNEHIISIQSYFEANGTAYFAMEYMEGVNLKQYMEQLGRRLEVYEANRILLPVMESLEWVHSKGVVHRDISPDNIMIRRDGTAKLIDFGAARYSTGEVSRSLDVILKHGFAPREQYTRRGRQGPFTDVYSMAATYYYAITGKVPPDAIDRTEKDELIRPSALGVKIRKSTEAALLKALAISASDRWQTMREFYTAMVQSMPNPFQSEVEKASKKPARGSEKPQKKQSGTTKSQTQQRLSTGTEPQNSQRGTTVKEEKSHAEAGSKPEETSLGKPRKKGGLIAALLLLVAAVAVAGFLYLKPNSLPASKPEATEMTSTPAPTPDVHPATPSPTLSPAPTTTPVPTPAASPESILTLPVSDYEVGDTLFFGTYEQDNNLENGKEDIEWLVLAKENNRLLVISRYALDCHKYHSTYQDVTWETCSLRAWLNETFLNTAFCAEEQAMIPKVAVSADKNPHYDTDPGSSTDDQVFLLSISETSKYLGPGEPNKCEATEYAIANGAYITTIGTIADEKPDCWWWLRSPGSDSSNAALVGDFGSVSSSGYNVNYDFGAVRPALWIDLTLLKDNAAESNSEADHNGADEEHGEYPAGYEEEKANLLSKGMKLIADDGTLLVAYLDNTLEVMLTGLDIEDSYVTNQAGDKNDLEYGWRVSFNDGNHDYDISTTSWRFDPGKNTKKTIDQMQQSLFVDHHYEADAAMQHSKDYIVWSVTVPDQFTIDYAKVDSFEITICKPGSPYEIRTVPKI